MIPSDFCTATAKSTGKRCGRLAIAGGTVCLVHGGGAPQVKQKALERRTLAAALKQYDHRPAWEVLEDALDTADVLAQQARRDMAAGDEVVAENLDRLADATERAARLAKLVLDAKVDERRDRLSARNGQFMAAVMRRAFERAGIPVEQADALLATAIAELTGRQMQIEGQVAS